MLCACRYVLLDQQVCVIKPTRVTNKLVIHELINDDLVE
jgi:hypothetical protein